MPLAPHCLRARTSCCMPHMPNAASLACPPLAGKSTCKMGCCLAVYADSEGRCVRCPEEHCSRCTSLNGTCTCVYSSPAGAAACC